MGGNSKNPDAVKKDINDIHISTFYKFIIDSLPVAIMTVNPELSITGFNRWAEEVTGYSAEEVMGRYCGDILQGGMCNTICPLKTVLSRQNPVVRVETTIRDRWGETITVRKNIAGLLDDNGKLIGGVEAFQDISDLKALEREKTNLISMFAHDMKSPLITIGGFVRRLLGKASDIDEEKRKNYLEIIRKEASRLELLVSGFLELSRLQADKLNLTLSATSLDKELMELFEAYEPEASKYGIKLELQNTEPLPIIDADTISMNRVFTNLLENALKFSKEKGTITVATQETDQDVIVKIKDQGVGIDPADLPYIFDPFHRGQGAGKKEGYGMGLAAVKAIVEAHGGRILVESKPGKGSIFTVVLPKAGKSKEGQ